LHLTVESTMEDERSRLAVKHDRGIPGAQSDLVVPIPARLSRRLYTYSGWVSRV
jgi:hypothetical protein